MDQKMLSNLQRGRDGWNSSSSLSFPANRDIPRIAKQKMKRDNSTVSQAIDVKDRPMETKSRFNFSKRFMSLKRRTTLNSLNARKAEKPLPSDSVVHWTV